MAEARNAADLYYLQKQGFRITGVEDGYYTLTVSVPYPTTMLQATYFSAKRLVKSVKNSIWPMSMTTLGGVVTGITAATVAASPDSWFRSGRLADVLWKIDLQANKYNPIHKHLAIEVKVAYLAALTSFVGILGIMTVEKFLLRLVLKAHPWIYLKYKQKPPLTMKLWAVVVKALSSRSGLTYSFGLSLPSLPLPSLKHTVDKYLQTVEPLFENSEVEEIKQKAKTFLSGEGKKLQLYLKFKWWTNRNYVAEWWEKYVYLRGRTPLAVNSNYYILDNKFRPTKNQTERAANVTHYFLKFKDMIELEQLEPLLIRGMIPLCMEQYRRMFGTCRVPGREFDALKHTTFTRHIIVVYRGEFFKVNVYHGARGTTLVPFSREQIKAQLDEIVDFVDKLRLTESKSPPTIKVKKTKSAAKFGANTNRVHSFTDMSRLTAVEEKEAAALADLYEGSGIAALTAGSRSQWAETREIFFSEGVNKASLTAIEKAAFVVVLDDDNIEPTLKARANSLFHGSGFNRYFDKSLSLIIKKDGYFGLNTEHSWADAPVVAHLFEWALLMELNDYKNRINEKKFASREKSVLQLDKLVKQDTTVLDRQRSRSESETFTARPIRLHWEISEQLKRTIDQAGLFAQTLIADVDLEVIEFTDYGSKFMKKSGCSPDAYVQMMLQLAYFRQQGRFDLTYESSMTRLFKEGRTETVRSLSNKSTAWVEAMEKNKSVYRGLLGKHLDRIEETEPAAPTKTKAELIKLLHEATDYHQAQSKDAMVGKGIDRHLFALYITSRGFGVDSEFLNTALSTPWRLSTSQQPQNQTDLRKFLPKEVGDNFVSPGGGFGPVADDGYGVSYMIVGDSRIFFHVSSKFSAPSTSSKALVREIGQAMADMKSLLGQD